MDKELLLKILKNFIFGEDEVGLKKFGLQKDNPNRIVSGLYLIEKIDWEDQKLAVIDFLNDLLEKNDSNFVADILEDLLERISLQQFNEIYKSQNPKNRQSHLTGFLIF